MVEDEDEEEGYPLSSLTCPTDGHVERVFLDSLKLGDLQAALKAKELTNSEYKQQKELLLSTCEHCGCPINEHLFKDIITIDEEERVTAVERRADLIKLVPQIAAMPHSLQNKVISSFQPIDVDVEECVVPIEGAMDIFFYVQSGKFTSYRMELNECSTPLWTYGPGSVMCERALVLKVMKSNLHIDCTEAGVLYCISGKTFRKLNEGIFYQDVDASIERFLKHLACMRHVPSEQIPKLARLAKSHTAGTSAEVTGLFAAGAGEAGSLFMIKSGQLSVELPHPHGEQGASSTDIRMITLKAGDMLSPVALSWFASLKRKAQEGKAQTYQQKKGGRKNVSWGPLPSEDDYVAMGYDSHSVKRAAATIKDPVVLLEFPAPELYQLAPDVRSEADLCIEGKILRLTEAFACLSPEQIDDLLNRVHSKVIDIPSGTVVSHEGKHEVYSSYGAPAGGHMYVVLDGGLRIWRHVKVEKERHSTTFMVDGEQLAGERDELEVARARRGTTIANLSSGDQFLAVALIDPLAARRSSVTAVDDTRCLMIDRSSLGPMFDQVKQSLLRERNKRGIEAARNKVPLSQFKRSTTIAKGGFGSHVCIAQAPDGATVALKTRPKAHLSKELALRANNEPTVLAACCHPGIVTLIGAYQDEMNLYLVVEGVLGGPLSKLQQGATPLTEEAVRFYAANTLTALTYLHSLHVVYRDLTMGNLLLDARGYVKFADFGNAKIMLHSEENGGHTFTFCGAADVRFSDLDPSHLWLLSW